MGALGFRIQHPNCPGNRSSDVKGYTYWDPAADLVVSGAGANTRVGAGPPTSPDEFLNLVCPTQIEQYRGRHADLGCPGHGASEATRARSNNLSGHRATSSFAMNPLSDDYLLVAAQISATLIGLLFVGIYYFLETGLGRLEYTREQVEPFIRSMSKLILLLFSGLFAFMQTGALLLESFDIHQQEEAAKTKHLQLDEETGTPSKEKKWTKARRRGLEERLGTAFQNGPPIRISQGGSSIEASIQLRPTISETGRAFIHTAITPLLVTSASNPFDTCLILVYDIAKRAVRVAPRLTYIDIRLWQELPDGGGELLLIAAFDVDKVKALIDQTEWTAADVRRVLDHQMVSPVLLGFGQAAT